MRGAFWWYATRATGLVAWGLATASVIWGYATSTRLLGRKPSPAWFLDLHRYLGGLTALFTLAHIGTLVADHYVHFGWAEILIPFHVRWHPAAVAWGVIGFYAMFAIQLTSMVMRRLPRKLWRAVHRLSLLVFVMITAHALSAGTDTGNIASWSFALATATLVLFLWLVNVLAPRRARKREHAPPAVRRPHSSAPHPEQAVGGAGRALPQGAHIPGVARPHPTGSGGSGVPAKATEPA